MKRTILMACLFTSLTIALADADINDARITEVWPGRSGADGTQDWIEVTNMGDTPIDTGNLVYDDSNPTLMSGGVLQSFNLGPGESVVFILDSVADNQMEFANAGVEFFAVWVPFDPMDLGVAGGGGGLGQGGDSANLLDASTGALIDTLEYSEDLAGFTMTIERIGDEPTDVQLSMAGQNGAFESQMFLDEATGMITVDGNGDPVILEGSPGVFMLEKVQDIIGDVNCDGEVNLLDVQPFVDLIATGGFSSKADINQDGSVDLLDVQPFVGLLAG